jgi:hypothetical protein
MKPQPDETFSPSSITQATNLIFTDPFFQLKKIVPKSNLTPLICRGGCKHYDGVADVNDGISRSSAAMAAVILSKDHVHATTLQTRIPYRMTRTVF